MKDESNQDEMVQQCGVMTDMPLEFQRALKTHRIGLRLDFSSGSLMFTTSTSCLYS